jgi:16S rRNA C967 or C1407 C5-methylase (RsmB/RsmF family)
VGEPERCSVTARSHEAALCVMQHICRWPSTEGPRHMLALLPHEHGTDGFFIARWVRRKPGGA